MTRSYGASALPESVFQQYSVLYGCCKRVTSCQQAVARGCVPEEPGTTPMQNWINRYLFPKVVRKTWTLQYVWHFKRQMYNTSKKIQYYIHYSIASNFNILLLPISDSHSLTFLKRYILGNILFPVPTEPSYSEPLSPSISLVSISLVQTNEIKIHQ